MFTSLAAVEFSRLLLFRNPKCMMPLHLSFFPYVIFHLLGRGASLYLGVFWFISIRSINIQMGSRRLNVPVLLACIMFLGRCRGGGAFVTALRG